MKNANNFQPKNHLAVGYFRRKAIQIMHEIFHVNELLSNKYFEFDCLLASNQCV